MKYTVLKTWGNLKKGTSCEMIEGAKTKQLIVAGIIEVETIKKPEAETRKRKIFKDRETK